MHKAISTKVQGKTSFETKSQQSQSSFLIFYFLCDFWIFDTRHKKIDKTSITKSYTQEDKQTTNIKNSKQTKQTLSQSIGSINAWTCCNAYA